MGRKLEFDREKALTKATELFWRDGYLNTSLQKLLKAMNLGESSFYYSFKSKKALYLECLSHYNKTVMRKRVEVIYGDGTPKERLYGFFEAVISDFENHRNWESCMMANSLSREVLAEKDLKKYVFDGLDSFISHIEGTIQKGIDDGEFVISNAKVTAKVLYTYLQGFLRLSVYKFDSKQARLEVNGFLDSLLLEKKD